MSRLRFDTTLAVLRDAQERAFDLLRASVEKRAPGVCLSGPSLLDLTPRIHIADNVSGREGSVAYDPVAFTIDDLAERIVAWAWRGRRPWAGALRRIATRELLPRPTRVRSGPCRRPRISAPTR